MSLAQDFGVVILKEIWKKYIKLKKQLWNSLIFKNCVKKTIFNKPSSAFMFQKYEFKFLKTVFKTEAHLNSYF